MIISEKIIELLKERGMSQREFSQRTGIAQSTISDWKRKHTNPVSEKILIICEVLEITPEELLSGTDSGNFPDAEGHYIILPKGSEMERFMVDYMSLPLEAKGRLKGYMQAIKDQTQHK